MIGFCVRALLFSLAVWKVAANCDLGASCSNVCCSSCSANDFFCPPYANPFPLSCISGTCQIPPPCAKNVCFSTKFNSQSVPAGSSVWLSAAFKPKFGGSYAGVAFTNSKVTINGAASSTTPPNSYVELSSGLQSCSTAQLVGNTWQAVAPLPGSGSTFLSAVSIPVPSGSNYAGASVTWCGDVTAPGEIDVQIAAAVYTSCPEAQAYPEACETQTKYHAGVPTGCLNNLTPGGTGGGGSNFSGSLSATYPVCRA